MEDVYTTEGKITPTTKFSSAEITGPKLPTISITSRVSKLGQHLHLIQTSHTLSNPTTEERTLFQWYVTFKQMHQEKHLTLLRGHPQLADQKSHNQRCKGHQEKSQPAYPNTDQTAETLVHVILVLNKTKNAMQVNRQTHQCSHASS